MSASSGTSFLTNDVATGKTVNVLGGVFGQPATLSLVGSRTNAGTIVLSNSQSGDNGRYTATFELDRGGRYGYTVRVVPSHPDLVTPVELGCS